jgi:sigma-54 dependent transcriptional regulator, acetoin dehydrogenase operon transcriptional activator AcoR
MLRKGMSPSSQSDHLPIGRDAQRAVERRWRATLTGGSVPETVRPIVRDSWARSLDAAVPPTLSQAPLVWDDNGVYVARERADWFPFAERVLDTPETTFAEGGHILTVFDAAGRMLAARGDPRAVEGLSDINFRPGALWAESVVGTNGPGTALASGRAVHIVGAEHFCERWQPWHCAAVPVRDPLTGAILAVLDISGFREAAHPHTLALAGTFAAAIEQMMAAQEAERRVIVLRALATLVGRWPTDGLAAVDRGGAILGGAGPLPHALERTAETPEPVRQALVDAVRRAGETGQPLDVRMPIGDGIAAMAYPVLDRGRAIGVCLVVPRQPPVAGRPALPPPPVERSAVRRPPRPGATRYTLDDVIGTSTSLAAATRLARVAASNALPVLLLGESGTGKEVFAQGVHAASARSRGPFVAVNCAALPRDLIESELFGYVGGAFSGARRDGQQGKFEAAQGGTIFLDEVVELSPAAQASLLRVLQEGEVTRVGSAYGHPVDVRVVAATNRDLVTSLASGALRQDLYYRLAVLTIPLPPLRERGAVDIELLALEFLESAARDLGLPAPALVPDALAALVEYAWPGNVRELKNLVRRLVAMADAPVITRDQLPPQMRDRPVPRPVADPLGSPSGDPARDELIAVVRRAKTMTAAARALGVTRSTLYRRMAQYGLRPGRALNDLPSPAFPPAKTS